MIEQKLLGSPRVIVAAPETKQSDADSPVIGSGGTFEGYASLFGIADLGNDVVAPGAFADTLRKRGARGVKMLWQHNASEPIGAWLDIGEDARGLRVRGKLNLSIARAREVLSLMRDGSVDGLSIGFRTEKATRDRKSGLRRLEQLDLWEISVVTFPMLPQARVSAVKRGQLMAGGIVERAEFAASRFQRALCEAANTLR